MNCKSIEEALSHNIEILSGTTVQEERIRPSNRCFFPSVESLKEIITIIKKVVFPDFFDERYKFHSFREHYIGTNIDRLYTQLKTEIGKALLFNCESDTQDFEDQTSKLAVDFISCIPEIKRLLFTDVEAMFINDPAADDFAEIILSYPAIHAMVHYRTAHALLKLGIPVIPRIITELAHSDTGIDINPGAEIGEYFAIDHGTGVVIGETSIVGNHVTLYQGVTLGAKNFSYDSNGHPVNIPRHPIIEDNVTIYSNSSILGRITVGRGSIIGGNVWLTQSVPPGSKIIQRQAVDSAYTDNINIIKKEN